MSKATAPLKIAVVSAIRKNFPTSLLESRIWLAYYYKPNKDGTLSKPPCSGYSVKDDLPGKTFDEVIKDGYPGIKMNKHHKLIAFDVDDKEAKLGNRTFDPERLSQVFKDFLKEKNSYTEISPSGCGLRIFGVCHEKDKLPGRINLRPDLCIGGEFFSNSGFVTVTGDALISEDIKEFTAGEISQWYKTNGDDKTNLVQQKDSAQSFREAINLPSLNHTLEALQECDLSQGPAVKRAYETILGQPYNHYDYWIRIMAAMHHYGSVIGTDSATIIASVLEWSQSDPEAYDSDDDIITHWSSFSTGESKITYHTLFKFARLIKFNWPKERLDKKGNLTGKPVINELVNFTYLMNYYDIKVYHEPYTNGLYVETDIKTIEKYFTNNQDINRFFGKLGPFSEESLIGYLWPLAQDNHYDNITLGTITPLAKTHLAQNTYSFNLMNEWLNTPYEELPAELKEPGTDVLKSNIEYLMSCIRFNGEQNLELAEIYFDAFFFGMAMPIYNPQRVWPEHNFMLILTGPENCRKSSFFSSLMPAGLKEYLVTHSTETLSSEKSLRDFKIQLCAAALLVIDEFEIFYTRKNDSLFKSLVTCDSVEYVPIYSKQIKKSHRTAALAGTTNKQKLPLEQDSSRRVALIEVEWIDTDKLSKINWHAFYSHYVEKGKALLKQHKYPWKLSQAHIGIQYDENERFRTHNDLEIILRELYDFDYEFPRLSAVKSVQTDTKWLAKKTDIEGTIKQKYPSLFVKPSALVNTLERLCGKWTKTQRDTKVLTECKGTIQKGVVKQGQYTRYFMPPKKTDF